MNSRTPENRIRSALDARLSGVVEKPGSLERVLRQARGERIVKKKLSVGLVLTIVLVLVTLTALAVALLWEQQVVPMKEIEQTQGDYVNWPISQKQVLIRALIDSGNIVESSETAKLFDDSTDEAARHAIADQVVLTLTGHTDVNEISVDIITYAIMGSTDTWTPEQRVWWQQVTNQFYSSVGNPDTLVTPNGKEPSEAEAIAIAKAAILSAYELSSDALDKALPVANLYVTDERPDYRRWDIQFKIFKEGTDDYLEKVYVAIVDENGEVIAEPDVGISTPQASAERLSRLESGYPSGSLYQLIDDLSKKASQYTFEYWSLELKAEYSQLVAPMVRAIVESGDLAQLNNDNVHTVDIIAASTYTYGLPGEKDITQKDAFAIAQKVIMERYHLDSQTVALYDVPYTYFDITDPAVPKWKIVFFPSYASAEHFPDAFASGQGTLRYKVEINSQTGEVIKAEEFVEQSPSDPSYKMILY